MASSVATQASTFSALRTIRLSTFQVGSAMTDILTASVWNRVMISDLDMPATPVSLLLALQYLLIPISIWAGARSDKTPLWGYYRTSYIWMGRLLVVLSFPLLGLSLQHFVGEQAIVGWLLALISFLMLGVGKLMSGSVFLALVRESAPQQKKGIAISAVETTLIALFVLTGAAFGRWMPVYEQTVFWQMIVGTMLIGGFFWWFAVVGIERRGVQRVTDAREKEPVREIFGRISRDPRTRAFFLFLSLATLAAWMQDAILEPYGGDVFNMEAGTTSQFVRYWGGATLVTLLISFGIWRKSHPARQTNLTTIGLALMAVGMLLTAASGYSTSTGQLYAGLTIYGAGFGLYTFGALSLMATMSPSIDAGAYLGLWTLSILVFKGLGTFLGGLLRDVGFLLNWQQAAAYALPIGLSGLLLLLSSLLVRRIDFVGFARETGQLTDSTLQN